MIAYSVAQRTREFGIRVTLDASRGSILCPVFWKGTVMALVGTAIAIACGHWLSKLLGGFVSGVGRLDAVTFATVPAALIVVAVLAGLVPAVRAVRLNPISARRE